MTYQYAACASTFANRAGDSKISQPLDSHKPPKLGWEIKIHRMPEDAYSQ
jgi:hypothetical protein